MGTIQNINEKVPLELLKWTKYTSLNKKKLIKWTTRTWGRAPPCGGGYSREEYLSHGVFAWDLLTCAPRRREPAFKEKYIFFKSFFLKKKRRRNQIY